MPTVGDAQGRLGAQIGAWTRMILSFPGGAAEGRALPVFSEAAGVVPGSTLQAFDSLVLSQLGAAEGTASLRRHESGAGSFAWHEAILAGLDGLGLREARSPGAAP